MLSENTGRLAAKFRSGNVHPLVCHLLDVAAVAEAVWRDCLADRSREQLAAALGLQEEEAIRWIAFLAGAHDIGKASPGFQLKGSPDGGRSMPPWLVGTPYTFRGLDPNRPDPGHGVVTAAWLSGVLEKRQAVDPRGAQRLAAITGGHHGIFPSVPKLKDVTIRLGMQDPLWETARAELADALATLTGISATPRAPGNAAALHFAGFISVVDWIGSIDGPDFFPAAGTEFRAADPAALRAYQDEARDRARKALGRLNWDAWPRPEGTRTFRSLFPAIEEPRDLQVQSEAIAPQVSMPGLVIIEAPMGEGKTEAAFYVLDCWNASGLRGAYIAMPTQATSNQLFGRFQAFLRQRYPEERVNLQLLHGHASLSDALRLLEEGGEDPVPDEIHDDEEDADIPAVRRGEVGAALWFTFRKRGLLAPFGVGTVDQALLAGLQVRHGFVRLFGLAGKTIVIDEVHAYDTYMSTLLERLLEWLAALGSSVVLLSATLPRSRREQLLKAYLRGLGREPQPLPDTRYPRITWTSNDGIDACHLAISRHAQRTLRIERMRGGREALPDRLVEQLRDGGCAAVICNTVGGAQEVYRLLKSAFAALPESERPELDLFHARFRFKDRDEREKRALARFGKQGEPSQRPRRAVLVATQVIEQSLDLDFDFMITEIAPIDLLLQRSGRLWRHEGNLRYGIAGPVLQVLWPEEDGDGLPEFDPGTAIVYEPHILLRTWYTLRERDSIAIPGDIEPLIDAVYNDSGDPPADATQPLAAHWAETWKRLQDQKASAEEEAKTRRIPRPGATTVPLSDYTRDPRTEDAPDLHPALQALTRLAGPSVDVVVLDPASPLLAATRRAPTRDEVRELVRHSLSLGVIRAVRALVEQKPDIAAWSRSPLLSRHRLLLLADGDSEPIGDLTFEYDPDLGLVILRP